MWVSLLLALSSAWAGPLAPVAPYRSAQYAAIGHDDVLHCTAFYFKTPGGREAPAYVLSAGHCYSRSTGEIFSNTALESQIQFKMGMGEKTPVLFKTRRVAYSTIKGHDLMIAELAATQADLERVGITPLELSESKAQIDDLVELVGFPANKESPPQMQRSTGMVTALNPSTSYLPSDFAHSAEGLPGMSGSPIFSLRTGKVVGINGGGVSHKKDVYLYSFAQFSKSIYGCFDHKGGFSMKRQSCGLRTTK